MPIRKLGQSTLEVSAMGLCLGSKKIWGLSLLNSHPTIFMRSTPRPQTSKSRERDTLKNTSK